MSQQAYHLPVMPGEVESFLNIQSEGLYVDCTLGGGGHAECLLEKYPGISILGIDRDQDSIGFAAKKLERFGARLKTARGNFSDIGKLLANEGTADVDGVFADLGVSSHQLDEPLRGFSFVSPNLDMRMDISAGATAQELVNNLGEEELADLIYNFGEERFSRRIAKHIVAQRQKGAITTGTQLAEIVTKAKPGRGRIHPATKVFQALRIAVNNELGSLAVFLESLPAVLKPGGRAVVISYHSLEDRIVKQAFKKLQADGQLHIITKKVVCAAREEERNNPRARSAKLRCAEKVTA